MLKAVAARKRVAAAWDGRLACTWDPSATTATFCFFQIVIRFAQHSWFNPHVEISKDSLIGMSMLFLLELHRLLASGSKVNVAIT